MSLCDTCQDPGHCCRDFPLNVNFQTTLEAYIFAARIEYWTVTGARSTGLPFVPTGRVNGHGRHTWHCLNLLPDGRCGDYANRPDLCASFEPGHDLAICVEWRPAITVAFLTARRHPDSTPPSA